VPGEVSNSQLKARVSVGGQKRAREGKIIPWITKIWERRESRVWEENIESTVARREGRLVLSSSRRRAREEWGRKEEGARDKS